MTKSKIINMVLVFCICLMLLFSSVVNFKLSNVSASGSLGIEAATSTPDDTKTMYYLKVPMKGRTVYLCDGDYSGAGVTPYGAKMRDNLNNGSKHTFIFTYNNVKVADYPLLTTWNCQVSASNMPVLFSYILKIVFIDDLEINIRSEYYDIFKDGDFTNINMLLLYDANAYQLYSESSYWWYGDGKDLVHNFSGAKVDIREVAADYDPIKEEGQIPDNGGIVADPKGDNNEGYSLLYTIYLFFTEQFSWNLSYKSFQGISAALVIVLIVGTFLVFIRKVFGYR